MHLWSIERKYFALQGRFNQNLRLNVRTKPKPTTTKTSEL